MSEIRGRLAGIYAICLMFVGLLLGIGVPNVWPLLTTLMAGAAICAGAVVVLDVGSCRAGGRTLVVLGVGLAFAGLMYATMWYLVHVWPNTTRIGF